MLSLLRSQRACRAVWSRTSLRGFATETTNAQWTDGPNAFNKLLVANRGEIACRVMRTAKRLGIRTVAVYSDVDVDSPHVAMADEAVCVGPAPAGQSYLVLDKILAAIKQTGAQAVHPGYGFLSENAAFVQLLEDNGVTFVGPDAHAIRAMGDKVESKLLAKKAEVNTSPGHVGVVEGEDEAIEVAENIGYPVMIKASAGGGGQGMRVAYDQAQVREGFRLSTQEAIASFGDGRIFLEKFVEEPRHIEIQIVADSYGNTVWLPERECSLQRRNQKVIEEAPSVFIDPDTRRAMGEQAVMLAKAVGYQSAGTVEFLCDKDKNFYFLEMNTRLQVEHPITEAITGVDLVEQMLRVAAGETLALDQDVVQHPKGWAVESRVYAEDPSRGYLPSIGLLSTYVEPRVPGGTNLAFTSDSPAGAYIRTDAGVDEGNEISMFYDPMISKLVTYGPDRGAAFDLMERALDRYVIRGVTHNTPFLRALCAHPAVRSGAITTKFLEEQFPEGLGPGGGHLDPRHTEDLLALCVLLHYQRQARALHANGASVAGLAVQLAASVGGQDFAVSAAPAEDGSLQVDLGGRSLAVVPRQLAGRYTPLLVEATVDGVEVCCQVVERRERSVVVQYRGATREVAVQRPIEARLQPHMPALVEQDFSKALRSPMPGSLVSVAVAVGDSVAAGDELAVVEAMKMQNVLRAEAPGVVKEIHCAPGSTLAADDTILEFE